MNTVKEMLEEAKMNAEVEVQKFGSMISQLEIDLKAAQDAGYDLAIKDQQIPASDKLYTEADLQAEKAFLQNQIDALNAEKATFEQDKAAAVASAEKATKLSIAAKIKDTQVDDLALAAELESDTQTEAQA